MELNLIEILAKEPSSLSLDELNFIQSYTAKLRAINKVAVEKGVVVKKVAKVVNPLIQVLADAFKVVIENNLEIIKELFPPETDKPKGQKGVNVNIDGSLFNVQLLNKAAFDHAREIAKAEKAAETATEAAEAAEAAETKS